MSEVPAPGDKPKSRLPEPGEPKKPSVAAAVAAWHDTLEILRLPSRNPPEPRTGPTYGRGLFRLWIVGTVFATAAVLVWFYLTYGGQGFSPLGYLLRTWFLALAVLVIGWLCLVVPGWVRRGFFRS